jgi:methylaspartate mutase sigma subunit
VKREVNAEVKAEAKPEEKSAHHRSGPLNVVVTGLSSDAHTWNLVLLQLLLEDLGHEVVNLGPCVPEHEVVEVCRKLRPDMLVVSSVNGHGFNDALPLISALRSHSELAGMPAVIGGSLGVTHRDDEARVAELLRAGFDAVFPDGRAAVGAAVPTSIRGADGLTAFDAFVGRLALETRQPASESL